MTDPSLKILIKEKLLVFNRAVIWPKLPEKWVIKLIQTFGI